MIVLKFGGSSVDCASSIARVVGIVRGLLPRRPVVVVSAMAKTTRQLLLCAGAAAAGDLPAAWAIFEELRRYHEREAVSAVPAAGQGALAAMLGERFDELRARIEEIAGAGRLTPCAADAVASYGELLASGILALALAGSLGAAGAGDEREIEPAWIDCRRVFVTDDAFTRARPIYEETDRRLRETLGPHLAAGRVPVLGGYVAATREGVTTTLGKEGSDFSAAIVGAALGAEEVQIWTDVDGMMTADPRAVPAARRVRTLSFAEALELACSGAKKPHFGTLGPAHRAGVPIRILNSWSPHLAGTQGPQGPHGTLIGARDSAAPPGVKSITCRDNARRVTLRARAADTPGAGFLAGVLALCERFRPALLVLAADERQAELALDREDRLGEIHAALAGLGEISLAPAAAVITLVSEDLAASPELRCRVMGLIGAAGREPRLVTTGAAAPCVRFTIAAEAAAAAVAELHAALFGDAPGDPVP